MADWLNKSWSVHMMHYYAVITNMFKAYIWINITTTKKRTKDVMWGITYIWFVPTPVDFNTSIYVSIQNK